jgi:hypothetical protein
MSGRARFTRGPVGTQPGTLKGGGALLVRGHTDGPDRVIHDLGRLISTVRSTDVSEQQLADIQAEIDKVAAN